MPAAAPLARRIFRSDGETGRSCPRSEPTAPRHDDRVLGAEGSPGADGQRGGDGLGHGDPVGDATLALQHRLHRLGDAVATDRGRPPGEQRDGEGAGHRRQRDQRAAVELGERGWLPAPLVEQSQAGDEADEVDEQPGGAATDEAEDCAERAERGEVECERMACQSYRCHDV